MICTELMGKVVVKCKCSLWVMMRCTVIHDDYDNENDLSAVDLSKIDCKIDNVINEGDQDDVQSSMFDVKQVSRILDSDLEPTELSPEKLLVITQKESAKSRKAAQDAESKAFIFIVTYIRYNFF